MSVTAVSRAPDGRFTPTAAPDVVHGTYAGAQWHDSRGIPTCQPCRAARADYMRTWRISQHRTTAVLVPIALVRRAVASTTDASLAIQLGSLLPDRGES